MSTPLEVARECWGPGLPDWVETLAIECGKSSQKRVAEQLDRSPAVISQVLRKIYPADTRLIEERVRGVFLDAKVACPGLGEVAMQDCQDWQAKARTFALGNPQRARMYRACQKCPRFTKEDPK